MADRYGLRRFKFAQDFGVYDKALEEVKNGRKTTHWIWFVFPQIKGIPGTHSHKSLYYGITCADEAREYLADPVLGSRLREITQTMLDCEERNPFAIFGDIDAREVYSCMTLFDYVSPDDIFGKVLDQMYSGSRCLTTLSLIKTTNTIHGK